MRTTIDFIKDAKEKLGGISDYRLAKIINVGQPTLSNYQSKARVLDDYTATKIAEILEIDPMIVISAANAEREKNAEKKNFWTKKYAELGGMAASVFMVVSLSFVSEDALAQPQASNSAVNSVYYVKLRVVMRWFKKALTVGSDWLVTALHVRQHSF